MQKILLYVVILSFPIILFSQSPNFVWDGGEDSTFSDTNWTTSGNWTITNPDGSSYPGDPNGTETEKHVVKLKTDTNNITLDSNVTISLIKAENNSGVPANTVYTIAGNYKITFTGTSQSKIIQIKKNGVDITFNCDVEFESPQNATKTIELGGTGNNLVTFSQGKTFTYKHPVIVTSTDTSHQIIFNGTFTHNPSSGTKDFDFQANTTAIFGITSDASGNTGDFLLSGDSASIGIAGPVQCRSLIMSGTSTAVIEITGYLTVTSGNISSASSLQTNDTSSITVKTSRNSSGSLIAKKASGTAIKVNFVRATDATEWTLISVPVTGETISDVISNNNLRTGSGSFSGDSAIGYYDNVTNGAYVYYNTDGSDSETITNGKGYLISPTAGETTVTFTGNLPIPGTTGDTGQVQVPVSRNSSISGNLGWWNLVGNPFTSYLNLNDAADSDATDNFLEHNTSNLNDSYELIYIWDGDSYTYYNNAQSTVNHVAPGDAFFVYVRNTNDAMNMNFRESMQVTGSYSNFNESFAQGSSIKNKTALLKFRLNDLETNEFDEMDLYFGEKVTRGLDRGYDGGKFFIKKSVGLFTHLLDEDQGIEMHVQALPYSDLKNITIPLGIVTNSPKLELELYESDLSDFYNIYLEDKKTNRIVEFEKKIKIDLFEEQKGMGRFYLHFTDQLIPELPTDDNLRIYKGLDSDVMVMGSVGKNYSAKVYDYSGRLIKEVNFNHKTKINDLDSKMKILRIESEEGLTIKKFKLN